MAEDSTPQHGHESDSLFPNFPVCFIGSVHGVMCSLCSCLGEKNAWVICSNRTFFFFPSLQEAVTSFLKVMCAKSLQSYPTLCDPMNCSLPDSFVHGIFQAKILEWIVMLFSRRSSQPRDLTHVSYVSCIDRRTTSGAT